MAWNHIVRTPSLQDFYDLFDDKFSCILIKDFLNEAECRDVCKAIEGIGLHLYDYQTDAEVPKARHIFDTHYLYEEKSPEEYFSKAKKTNDLYGKFCLDIGFDPTLKVRNYLKDQLKRDVSIAQQDDQLYTHTIVRELKSSALLHADYARFVPPYWSISNMISQYAWNIYLTDPEHGGECVVYNKLWQQEDDKYIMSDTYGYDPNVVTGKDFTEIKIKPGQLLFFNSRNFHEVKASSDLRLSMGGHIGLNENNEILMWV